MITLKKDEIKKLKINQLIFHVVQHEGEEPTLLKQTPIAGFEGFFLERIKETLEGNSYKFTAGSKTLNLLRAISDDPDSFVPNSQELARNFHKSRSGRIKAGAIILMQLSTGDRELFSLIKYDHEQVIAYDLEQNSRAVLKEILNSFTKSKDALQKSALIELSKTKKGGELVVIDRTVSYDITDFFKNFLEIKPSRPASELTQSVQNAVVKTAIKHKNDLPNSITSRARAKAYDAIQKLEHFNEKKFLYMLFGAYSSPEIQKTFRDLLGKEGIIGARFKFDMDAIQPPTETKYSTIEGVRLIIDEAASSTVDIQRGNKTKLTTITITTQQLIQE